MDVFLNDTSPPEDWSRFYVPEIHDVYPGMEARLDEMLAVLSEEARRRVPLLVVPEWQGSAPLADAPALCAWLAGLPGEKVLHGWTHSLGPDFLNWLLYGHDNRSEFARLGKEEARERIFRGVAAMESALGAQPRWFCAPRWQQGAATKEVLREAGFRGYMLRSGYWLMSGETVPLSALCFDEGERRLRNALLRIPRQHTTRRRLARGTPFRLTLHPADPADPAAWAEVKALVARLEAEGWRALSHEEAIALWRRTAGAPQVPGKEQ